jgi:hypothetical protein
MLECNWPVIVFRKCKDTFHLASSLSFNAFSFLFPTDRVFLGEHMTVQRATSSACRRRLRHTSTRPSRHVSSLRHGATDSGHTPQLAASEQTEVAQEFQQREHEEEAQ